MNSKNFLRGFTLIELLVVISIIGLLSSVVLASLSTARDRANVGAGKQFDVGIYRNYGADASAHWKMEAISASKIADDSPNLLDLNVLGTPVVETGVFGNAIRFPTASDYAQITFPTNSAFARSSLNGGTITLWVKLSNISSTQYILSTRGNSLNRLYVYFTGGIIKISRGDPIATFDLGPAKLNEWVNVGISWTGGASGSTQTMRGYLNGRKVGETSYTEGGTFDAFPLRISGFFNGGGDEIVNGLVDEIRIYKDILADSEIRDRYLAELNKIQDNNFASK